jgi:hypothetical protein
MDNNFEEKSKEIKNKQVTKANNSTTTLGDLDKLVNELREKNGLGAAVAPAKNEVHQVSDNIDFDIPEFKIDDTVKIEEVVETPKAKTVKKKTKVKSKAAKPKKKVAPKKKVTKAKIVSDSDESVAITKEEAPSKIKSENKEIASKGSPAKFEFKDNGEEDQTAVIKLSELEKEYEKLNEENVKLSREISESSRGVSNRPIVRISTSKSNTKVLALAVILSVLISIAIVFVILMII